MFLPSAKHTRYVNSSEMPWLTSVGHRLARNLRRREKGLGKSNGETLVEVDLRYFRPTKVDFLLGDSSKARAKLGWRHRTNFDTLVSDMVKADITAVLAERETPQSPSLKIVGCQYFAEAIRRPACRIPRILVR
jgi:GDP-D-mannose dehydratase